MDKKQCRCCAMMIPIEAKRCPYCRKKQNIIDIIIDRIFWTFIIFILLMFLLFKYIS
jgi:hypothetical protein